MDYPKGLHLMTCAPLKRVYLWVLCLYICVPLKSVYLWVFCLYICVPLKRVYLWVLCLYICVPLKSVYLWDLCLYIYVYFSSVYLWVLCVYIYLSSVFDSISFLPLHVRTDSQVCVPLSGVSVHLCITQVCTSKVLCLNMCVPLKHL